MNKTHKLSDNTREYHVASFVAHAIQAQLDEVVKSINDLQGTEIHAISELGKIVFTVEANHQRDIASVIDTLNLHIGLFSLAPIYHQFLTNE